MRTVTATCYLQIEGVRDYDWSDVSRALARRVTNKRPKTTLPSTRLVKLNVRIPASAWDEMATVDVDLTPVIEVNA